MQVLVVDHDDDPLRLVAGVLTDHDVETTSRPRDALKRILKGDVSLVIAHWQMPEMSGVELCRKVRAADLPHHVYIILVTARDGAEDLVGGLANGADEFIGMPVDPAELKVRVRSIERLKELREHLEHRVMVRTRELVAARRDVESIISSIPDSLLTIDPEGRVGRINQPLADLLGYTEEEVVGKSVDDLLGSGFHENAVMRDQCMDGLVWNLETFLLAKDGRKVPVLLSGSQIRNDSSAEHGLVCIAKDITERVQAERQIRKLAFYDSLTGLPNWRLMLKRVQSGLKWAKQHGRLLGLLYLDLDRFKDVNDTLGHDAGDQLLCKVSERLLQSVRLTDHVAHGGSARPHGAVSRFGGDEFIVLLTMIATNDNAAMVAGRINRALSASFTIGSHEIFTSASVGIALYPEDGANADVLLRNADTAMYSAKSRGRNSYAFYAKTMSIRAMRKLDLENRLRRALDRDEFAVHYQPIFDTVSGKLTGAEALLRWSCPEKDPVSPREFIPIAEDAGLIVAIDEWVFRAVCAQAKAWRAAGIRPFRLAVNLSTHHLRHPNLCDFIARALREYGLDPGQFEIEITETALLQDDRATAATLDKLAELGVGFALDDFGTGYSSLSHLLRFPIRTVKIDRCFVGEITRGPDGARFTAAIIAMAHSLGLRVIAEGVETVEHEDFLRENGCDELQGFLFSPAVPPDELALIAERNASEITNGNTAYSSGLTPNG